MSEFVFLVEALWTLDTMTKTRSHANINQGRVKLDERHFEGNEGGISPAPICHVPDPAGCRLISVPILSLRPQASCE
jgi:hypothetical protein